MLLQDGEKKVKLVGRKLLWGAQRNSSLRTGTYLWGIREVVTMERGDWETDMHTRRMPCADTEHRAHRHTLSE